MLTRTCLLLVVVATALFGQSAEISGLVTDPAGAAVPHASVEVRNQDTSINQRTATNGEGLYSVIGLRPGNYTATVQATGFKTVTLDAIVLQVEQHARLDLTLELGAVEEKVTVSGDAVLVNITDASVSTVVDRDFVENIPLNGRTFQSLINLTPGVVTTPTPVAGEQGQFSVAGQRAGSNYFSIDGASVNFAAGVAEYNTQTSNGGLPAFSALGSTASLVSVDAVQEFRLESSTYAPEFGRQSGAQVILVTRSGTNAFHGTAFDYLRNDALDASDWFASSTGQAKPRERQNDFGGVLGGPIRKNKTFFFFSYEGLRVTQPLFQVSQVPSLAARASAPANVKPVVDAFPLPNGPTTGGGLAQLSASSPNDATLDASSLRIDQSLGSNVHLFGRFNHSPSSLKEAYGGYPGSNPFETREDVDTGTLGLTATLTPTITNEFHFNYSRAHGSQLAGFSDFGGAIVPPTSAIFAPFQKPETSNAYFFVSDGLNENFSVGRFGDNLSRQTQFTDSLSIAKGTHLMKFGFDFRRLTPTQGQPASFVVYGWFANSSFVSGDNADILAVLQDHSDVRQLYHNFSGFAQDTWKLSPRLTLTYGVRWDHNPPPTETNGAANAPYAISQIKDLTTATLLPPGSRLWNADWKNFAPRVGVAYQLWPNSQRPLVLRAGFGQFYDLGTDTAGFLNNGQGWFPYSLGTTLCLVGSGTCGNAIPYNGPEPPFVFTQSNDSYMRAFDPHLKLPYALEWNVALEQTISPNQTFKITYLGSVGRRLLRDDLVSNPNPNTTSMVGAFFLTTNTAHSNYNALQLQFQRRLSNGLQALVSYSWSHSLDVNSSNVAYIDPYLPADLYNVRQDYGNSDFDIRQSFSAALTYNIPLAHVHNSVLRTVLRNWSIDSNNTARTGTPFNVVYYAADQGLYGTLFTFVFRPDQVPGQPVWVDNPNAGRGKQLNLAAFSIPSTSRQGTEGRNNIRGFPLLETDLAVRRQFNITERIRLQFRAEAFNFINHPNFGNPSNNIGTCTLGAPCTPLFGWGTSRAMLNESLGASNFHGTPLNALYQVGGPRSLQVSMKLQF